MAAILIVDDCSPMRLVIKRILGMSGFEMEACYFAGDGLEALAALRRHHIDLVISDVNMPRMDGEAMLQSITADEDLCKVPVVMVSSDATQSRAHRLLELGAKAYIVKPFHPEAFREQLESALEAAVVDLSSADLNTMLGQVTEEVLEHMFFSGVAGEPETPATGERLCATVSFTGTSRGVLGVSVPSPVAAVLAAAFLGSEDEATDETQVRAIVGEIANVICGVVLARMNADGQFAISSPDVTTGEDAEAVGNCEIRRHFEIIEGDLSVGLTVH